MVHWCVYWACPCIHAFMHVYEQCVRVSLCVSVCVCVCAIGAVGRLVGGVFGPFFKHSCVVMVAWAFMLPKPPTKRLSFSAPDSGEGNDFQIGGPTHHSRQTGGGSR